MSKHKIRDIGVVRVRRLDERYAEKDQVGFIGFSRADSAVASTPRQSALAAGLSGTLPGAGWRLP
jgi:hypothetical protein